MTIVSIDPVIARPFVYAACSRAALPYDTDSGGAMLWWGAFGKNSLRAVAGLAQIDDDELALFGPFGDGSLAQGRFVEEMLREFALLPVRMTVIVPSTSPHLHRLGSQIETHLRGAYA